MAAAAAAQGWGRALGAAAVCLAGAGVGAMQLRPGHAPRPQHADAPSTAATPASGTGARSVSTVAEKRGHSAEECDCAPLWACMEAGKGGCEMLDRQLRACLAWQKLNAARQGETVAARR